MKWVPWRYLARIMFANGIGMAINIHPEPFSLKSWLVAFIIAIGAFGWKD